MYFPHSYKAGKEILLFCHVGEKEWTTHEFPEQGWPERLGSELGQSICYCKSKLYIIGPYILLEIEIKNESEPKTILSISEIQVGYEFKDNRPDYFVGRNFSFACMTRHYVESSDEMFMITKYFIPRGVYEYCVTIMFILKLDFSSMSWVEVTSMDDHVLFISRTTRLCCSAKELGFARGWVYFTQPDEMSFYKYDFEDKTVMLSLPCPDLPNPWFSPNWLMIPTPLCRNDDHRGRGTESMLGNNRYGGNNTKIIQISSLAISLIRNSTDDDMKENFEEARPWGMLIEDILWFISSYLSPLDYTHLRAVCRNYRSVFPIMDWRKFCYPRTLQTNVSSPWMVFPKHNGSVFSFINPVHNDENYLTSIPELLKGLTIRCSKGGWLLMSDEIYRMFFCNPFTKEVIHLPKFMVDPRFRGISFSSLPTSSDCVVFAVGDESDSPLHITCIKRGQDKWMDEFYPTSNMNFDLSLNSPIFYNGAFYCLDLNGTLGAFSLENGMSWEVFSMVPPPDCGFIYKSYLVELEGKLLSILLGHYGRWVRVFRLDMSEMVWVEVEHLGRHVLFISNTSCMGRIAPTSQMENKIYFPRLQNQGILYYSLDSGTYHSLGSEHYGTDYCNSKDNLRCSWIEPNWSETLPPNFVW